MSRICETGFGVIALVSLGGFAWRYDKNRSGLVSWGAGFATGMVIGPLMTMLM
jgi:hypothetical protein